MIVNVHKSKENGVMAVEFGTRLKDFIRMSLLPSPEMLSGLEVAPCGERGGEKLVFATMCNFVLIYIVY